MKAPHLDNQSKLAKWLLIVTLLCILFACLGDDIICQNGQPLSAKTELVLATRSTVKQAQPVQEKQRPNPLYTASRSSQITALTAYNEWVIRQLNVVSLTNFTFTRFTCSLPVKTIAASADGPFLSPFRG